MRYIKSYIYIYLYKTAIIRYPRHVSHFQSVVHPDPTLHPKNIEWFWKCWWKMQMVHLSIYIYYIYNVSWNWYALWIQMYPWVIVFLQVGHQNLQSTSNKYIYIYISIWHCNSNDWSELNKHSEDWKPLYIYIYGSMHSMEAVGRQLCFSKTPNVEKLGWKDTEGTGATWSIDFIYI